MNHVDLFFGGHLSSPPINSRNSQRIIIVYLLAFLALGACTNTSREYFVSPAGLDTNAGTQYHPLASIGHAIKMAEAELTSNHARDATIWLEPGVHRISTPIQLSSEKLPDGARMSMKSKQRGSAIVSGGISLQKWRHLRDDLWELDLNEIEYRKNYLREIFINGQRAPRARFPNQGYLRVSRVGEDKRTSFFYSEGDFPIPHSITGTELVLFHDWSISRVPISSVDINENRVICRDTIGATVLDFFTLDHWEAQPRYFLENDLAFIDEDYEWCYNADSNRVIIKIPGNQNIDSLDVMIPISEGLIALRGSVEKPLKNVHFENLIFRHTSWNIPRSGYAGIQATYHDPRPNENLGWSVPPAAIAAMFADSCSFLSCDFENLGASGLWLATGCTSNLIMQCTFRDISGNAIMVGEGRDRKVDGAEWWRAVPKQAAAGNRLEACTIQHCGVQFYGAVGIWCGLTKGTIIQSNSISHLPYTGISIGWMWNPTPTPAKNNMVSGNHIHHIMQKLSDGGGIYMLGLQPGSELIGNLIHDVTLNVGRAESNGMFLDEGITDVVVANNLIYNIAKSPIRFHRATRNLVRDNLLFCETDTPPFTYISTDSTLITRINNRVFHRDDSDYQQALNAALKSYNK